MAAARSRLCSLFDQLHALGTVWHPLQGGRPGTFPQSAIDELRIAQPIADALYRHRVAAQRTPGVADPVANEWFAAWRALLENASAALPGE